MQDPRVELMEFIKTNYSSANPTLTQMSGRMFTSPTERPFMTPSLVIGPSPQAPDTWLSQFQLHYRAIVPITAYAAYDVNPLTTGTTEQTAKIQRYNMIDSVRNLISNSKNLSSDGKVQLVTNKGTWHELTLTKWRPGVLATVTNVEVEWVDDISNSGVIP